MITYSFYTYSKVHYESIVITIKASDEDSAWELFETQYPDCYVDQVTFR